MASYEYTRSDIPTTNAEAVADDSSAFDLSARATHLLRSLVESYIESGQAVSSRALVRCSGLNLSSATVRNVMANLEEMGLICSPHTSAGRVPTARGYRFFVNYLMRLSDDNSDHANQLSSALAQEGDTRSLLVKTSGVLSRITHMAGIVMAPRNDTVAVRHVEFVPLSSDKVLVILVHSDRDVQNRILQLPAPVSAERLREISRAVSGHLAKRPDLASARDSLLAQMRSDYGEICQLMSAAMSLVESRTMSHDGDYVMVGESNLMAADDLADMNKLRTLFDSFNRKNEMLELLDRAINARGVQIFIGEESGYEAFRDCSVVTSSYARDGRPVGVVGVIGPTRMRYNDVVPVVNLAAQALSDVMSN